MDIEHSFDETENIVVDSGAETAFDIEAVVKAARRSRQIEEADVQAILASADDDQADLGQ